jgi:uncharacterized phage protein (TIGR01671 family)
MEREIKFRAWVTYIPHVGLPHGKPYMAKQGNPDLETLQSFMHHYGDEPLLMQYTGLKDKNSKEIYEGDILRLGKTCSFVVWGLDGWRFNSYMERGVLELYPYVDRTNGKEVAEIIGNIYEHKHLLAS